MIRANDRVCILAKIFHAFFEAPQAADATFQAKFCKCTLTTLTPETNKKMLQMKKQQQ